jgi:hypothetical protein
MLSITIQVKCYQTDNNASVTESELSVNRSVTESELSVKDTLQCNNLGQHL